MIRLTCHCLEMSPPLSPVGVETPQRRKPVRTGNRGGITLRAMYSLRYTCSSPWAHALTHRDSVHMPLRGHYARVDVQAHMGTHTPAHPYGLAGVGVEGDRSDHAGSRMTPHGPQKQGCGVRFYLSGVSGPEEQRQRLDAVFDPHIAHDLEHCSSRVNG